MAAAGRWRGALEARLTELWYGPAHAAPGRAPLPAVARKALGLLLAPPAALVAAVAARRRRRISRTTAGNGPAVVVVGNLVAGGAGKTPATIALALALAGRGLSVGLLARGHGAQRSDARLVGPDDDPSDAGDEPLLLARATGLPVAAGVDRAAALARLAAAHPGLDVVVSDDGLQHTRLARDVEIAVFDARGAGNGRTLPAGPLREPLAALASVDAVLLNGAEASPFPHPRVHRTRLAAAGVRALHAQAAAAAGGTAHVRPMLEPIEDFVRRAHGQRLVALAAIGAPQRFFGMLRSMGLAPTDCMALPDHAPIPPALLDSIHADLVLMTEKDAVKCERFADARCHALVVQALLDPALVDYVERRVRSR